MPRHVNGYLLPFLVSICLCCSLQAKEPHVCKENLFSNLEESKGLRLDNSKEISILHENEQIRNKIQILSEPPSPEEFVALRAAAGMRQRSVSSAEKGLKNSLFWVTLRYQGQLIGMGRVIGDGGTAVQVSDIAVHPHFQKLGYGKLILETIQDYILREIPDDAFVCLFAEKKVAPFYQNYGYCFGDQWLGTVLALRRQEENSRGASRGSKINRMRYPI